MIFRALLVLVLIAASVTADARAADPVTPPDAAAVLVTRVAPRYPAKAIERGQEGWVDLSFSITPEGTTSGVRLIAEYPHHVFTRAAYYALAKWVYTPRMENGVAVPQGSNHAVLSFALEESSAIRDNLVPQFTAARQALAARNWDEASQAIDQVGESETLRLYELGVLEDLRGRLAFGKHAFGAAADHFERALAITARFTPEFRSRIAERLTAAALNDAQVPRALQTLERWPLFPRDENRDLRHAVEAARAALAAGRQAAPGPVDLPRGDD